MHCITFAISLLIPLSELIKFVSLNMGFKSANEPLIMCLTSETPPLILVLLLLENRK